MVRSRTIIIYLLAVCFLLPIISLAQQDTTAKQTKFIVDDVLVRDTICVLDNFTTDSARVTVSKLFPEILPGYISQIKVESDSTFVNNIVKITTDPQRSFQIVIDGEPCELPEMTFGIWLNENERGEYLQSFLNNLGITLNDISEAIYVKNKGIVGCDNPLPTILIVTKQKKCDTDDTESGTEPMNNLAKIILNSIKLWQ